MQHGKFRAMWEDKLEDWDEAAIPNMDEDTFFRRYLSKLPLDLNNAAMSRSWPLDGKDNPHRKCKTWQDVADAVDMELDTRLDTRALLAHPGSVYAVHEGGGGERVSSMPSLPRNAPYRALCRSCSCSSGPDRVKRKIPC